MNQTVNQRTVFKYINMDYAKYKVDAECFSDKAVPLHAMEALGGRGGIAPTHSRPLH
jgi:hypothetical protein